MNIDPEKDQHPEEQSTPANTPADSAQAPAVPNLAPTPQSPPTSDAPSPDLTQSKIAHNTLLSDHSEIGLDAQRRTHQRQPFASSLTVHHIDPSDNISDGLRCPALDISVGGLCFRSRRCYWKLDRLLILIRTRDRSTRIVFAEVRHCAYDGGGNHRVGVRFIESPKSKRVLSWLAENVVE